MSHQVDPSGTGAGKCREEDRHAGYADSGPAGTPPSGSAGQEEGAGGSRGEGTHFKNPLRTVELIT